MKRFLTVCFSLVVALSLLCVWQAATASAEDISAFAPGETLQATWSADVSEYCANLSVAESGYYDLSIIDKYRTGGLDITVEFWDTFGETELDPWGKNYYYTCADVPEEGYTYHNVYLSAGGLYQVVLHYTGDDWQNLDANVELTFTKTDYRPVTLESGTPIHLTPNYSGLQWSRFTTTEAGDYILSTDAPDLTITLYSNGGIYNSYRLNSGIPQRIRLPGNTELLIYADQIDCSDEIDSVSFSFTKAEKTVERIALAPDTTPQLQPNQIVLYDMGEGGYIPPSGYENWSFLVTYSDGSSEIFTGKQLVEQAIDLSIYYEGATYDNLLPAGGQKFSIGWYGYEEPATVTVLSLLDLYADAPAATDEAPMEFTVDEEAAWDNAFFWRFTPEKTAAYSLMCEQWPDFSACSFKIYDSTNKPVSSIIGDSSLDSTFSLVAGKEYLISLRFDYLGSGKNTVAFLMKSVGAHTHQYSPVITPADLYEDGKSVNTCIYCGKVSGTKTIYRIKTVSLSANAYFYDGKAHTPTVTVKDRKGNKLKANVDYFVDYDHPSSTQEGDYGVYISFAGKYCGYEYLEYRIISTPGTPDLYDAYLNDYNSVELEWNEAYNATHHYVYYKKASSSKWTLKAKVTGNSYEVKGLSSNTMYDFKVVAYATIGSKSVQGGTSEILSCATSKKLSKISGLKATLNGPDSVTLSWNKVKNANLYVVGGFLNDKEEDPEFIGYSTENRLDFTELNTFTTYQFIVIPCVAKWNEDIGELEISFAYQKGEGKIKVETGGDLPALTGLSAELYGYDDIKLSWDKVEGASSYWVYYKKSTDSKYSSKGTTKNLYMNIKDLADGVSYDFKVYACSTINKATVKDDTFAEVSLATTRNLSAPKTFTATRDGYKDVNLSWSKVNYATSYQVSYKKSADKDYTVLDIVTETSYAVNILEEDTRYTFKVVPCTTVNGECRLDDSSKTVSLSTSRNVAPITGLKAELYGYDDIKLSWDKVEGATSYWVYYKKSTDSKFTSKGTTKNLYMNIKDLSDGVRYDFHVYACVTVDKKAVKDDDVAAVSLETTRNLSAPKTASAKLFQNPDTVRFTWSSVNYATSYQVYYKASSEKSYTLLGDFTETEVVVEGLMAGTGYTFKVVPCTFVNDEIFADTSSKTASVTTLKQISTPTVKKSSSTKVKISWKNIGGETGYQISVSADPEATEIASTYKTTSGKSKTLTVTKGETLYYKVRAYTVVNGEYIYGEWSEVVAYTLK